MSAPRMRTAPQCITMLRELDPETAFTLRALRRMIAAGDVPAVEVGNKKLIDFDKLLLHLSEGTPAQSAPAANNIRRLDEARRA